MKYKHEQTYGPKLIDILNDVLDAFNVSVEMVKGTCRKGDYVKCRKIFIHVAVELTDATLNDIGSILGLDHTTCIFHRDTTKGFLDIGDPKFMREWSVYINRSKIWNEYNKKVA